MEKFGLKKLQSESGATAVEYIIIALILIIVIAFVFTLLGVNIRTAGTRVANCVSSGGSNC